MRRPVWEARRAPGVWRRVVGPRGLHGGLQRSVCGRGSLQRQGRGHTKPLGLQRYSLAYYYVHGISAATKHPQTVRAGGWG